MTEMPAAPVLAGMTYWRKNPFLASSMVPLLLLLAEGRFTAIGPEGTAELDVDARAVNGSLGRMGTFKIVVNGTKYALVGRGSIGGTETGHTEAQRQVLEGFVHRFPAVLSAPRGSAGVVDAVLNGSAAATMAAWRDALAASGAAVS